MGLSVSLFLTQGTYSLIKKQRDNCSLTGSVRLIYQAWENHIYLPLLKVSRTFTSASLTQGPHNEKYQNI